MSDARLDRLTEMLTLAHAQVQQNFADVDPVVGVRRALRQSGFPADLISVDNLKNGKRILLLLHDEQPQSIGLQYSMVDQDPDENFEFIEQSRLDSELLYQWMRDYLREA